MSHILRLIGMLTCPRFKVTGFLGGERDYSKLKGDTGPLVYPAGFLYIYSAIQYITGGEVYPAQVLFGILYIVNLGMVLFIYLKTDVVPWWALCLLSLSKRVHSIFVLRLFNDCFATTLFHAALISFIHQKWHMGLIIFSGAVSVKMNVLLFAPPLFILLLKAMDVFGVITSLAGAALLQIVLALPFLLSHPIPYISRAFNLGRVFIHFWSVNFKFVPEPVFISKELALFLLATHLILLAIFCHYRWCRHEGGLFCLIHSKLAQMKLKVAYLSSFPLNQLNKSNTNLRILTTEHIVTTMFVGNFIGIVCARSLHYQFYSWYFYSLPYLLWRTPFPVWLRLVLFAAVEFCWNVYPSNTYSSLLLLAAHLAILGGLWAMPPEYPYSDFPNDKSHLEKKAS
ncbi:dol-P-Man:Man(5)GlcNAc(2)-PP-Dol alpha-1,3-mannosyltransferase isoform X2 [Andrographis paniculata]|uniref:dol-P-Man:Man(5)GlcNAc(2)-PP-Dol alpha-1,3-mannosyltransferase isoform X2 n=1 Tax=Andrographis paniculata TaxID=175694 RepID=UPI0021E91522|nr:dol-P-Man:Man(5)GlcNAc(2)-PP-Dol alpha-1,3-mannosyltransferase isoform X2 [Andrographis paniculata]